MIMYEIIEQMENSVLDHFKNETGIAKNIKYLYGSCYPIRCFVPFKIKYKQQNFDE